MNMKNMKGQKLVFSSGQPLLEVAQSNQIHIATLCHFKGATPTGACRICVVEVKGVRTLPAACSTPASDNMIAEYKACAVRIEKLTS